MRLSLVVCLCLVALIAGWAASVQDIENPLRLYALRVDGGRGVYLGNGVVITAAHLVTAQPHVAIAGRSLPAKVMKLGDSSVDLAVLSIDQHVPNLIGLRHLSLCSNAPKPTEAVLLGLPEGMLESKILLPSELPSGLPSKYYHENTIRYVLAANSGSGVFDPKVKCLLGIITQKITVTFTVRVNGEETKDSHDIAKYFIPASEIARFIPPEIQY